MPRKYMLPGDMVVCLACMQKVKVVEAPRNDRTDPWSGTPHPRVDRHEAPPPR